MSPNMSAPFRELAVTGAGDMESGIVRKYATQRFPLDENGIRRGFDGMRRTVERGVERKLIRFEQVEQIFGWLEGTTAAVPASCAAPAGAVSRVRGDDGR